MKTLLISVLILNLSFISCLSQPMPNTISSSDIIKALKFAMENVVLKKYDTKCEIFSLFDHSLNDATIYKDIIGIDAVLDETNVHYMIEQYNSLAKKEIKPYIQSWYNKKLVDNCSRDKNITHLEFSAPMFSYDKKTFVLHVLSIFDVKGNPKWDGLYFVFSKKNDTWKLIGLIKRNM